ncbi:unnamed protein product [Calypogeia fissa]
MAKKRKAQDKSPEQQQQMEPITSPSESKEDEEEVSTSSGSDPGSDSDSDSEVEEEDSPLSSPSPDDIVDVDFEFFDPKPDDFHGAKALLRTYLDDVTWDINGCVDLFLAQTTVGSVIKTSEEESPIGLISALNLARYQDCPCMKHIQHYIESKAKEKPEAKQVERFWTKKANQVGLLVSERLINIPMELVPPLYEGLFEEILWATEDEPTEELQNSFKFKHYLVLTKVFEELPKTSKSSRTGQKQLENGKLKGELIFIKPEDEILLKLSSWSFTFEVKAEASASHETKNMRQLRLVMGLKAEQIPVFMTELKELVE